MGRKRATNCVTCGRFLVGNQTAAREGNSAQCTRCLNEKWTTDYRPRYRKYRIAYRRRLREEMITGLGGACVSCAETTFELLTVDHIHGGGQADHRQGSMAFPLKVRREGFPRDKYRVLCWNCHMSWSHYRKMIRGGKTLPDVAAVVLHSYANGNNGLNG